MAANPPKFRPKSSSHRRRTDGVAEDSPNMAGVSSKAELKRRQKALKASKSGGFESLGLCPEIYNGVKRKGYRVPTPIQRKTMPLILAGADVVAMARTGSGKTAAFLVPMLQKLRQHDSQVGVRALILSPTRDLAIQTLKFTKELGKYTDLRTSLLVGGDSMENQFEELAQNPDIIIATPGRLMHHLAEVDGMSLHTVQFVVFDEADNLFEMGFAEQLHKILTQLSETRQTLLFSATLPSTLADFAKSGLRDPQLIRLDLDTKISPDLKLAFFTLRHEEKLAALLYLVREHISSDEQTLIFVSTKYHVELLSLLFKEEGIESSVSYSDMDQEARRIHISKFRARKTMLLIVTDIAARGLDIPLLDNVINWDFPGKPKLFVHRVGRVARAGRTGTAYSFVTSEDMPYLLDLHLFLSKPLKPAPTEQEVLKDMDGVYLKIDQALQNGHTIYGRFPQSLIDLVSDRVKEIMSENDELQLLQKTCAKAFQQYSKLKPLPSRASIKRIKDLPREGLHPMFRDLLGSNELTAIAFSERLKSFRPKQTILEAEGEAAKAKGPQGSNQWLEVMRKKREVHEEVIRKTQEKHSHDKVKMDIEEERTLPMNWDKKDVSGVKRKEASFRDEEYYISSMPTNQHLEAGLSVKNNEGFGPSRLEAAVLDLAADDSTGLQKQKSQYHWDKKSKKYIKLNNGERVNASGKIKTESGAIVKGKKTGIYKKWKDRSHQKITLGGVPNEESTNGGRSQAGGYQGRNTRSFRGGRQRWSVPNSNVQSELKNPEQVRKTRQNDANKAARFKNKASKGKKHGKSNRGKRGRK